MKAWLIDLEDRLIHHGITDYEFLYSEPVTLWLNEHFTLGYSIDHVVDCIIRGEYPHSMVLPKETHDAEDVTSEATQAGR